MKRLFAAILFFAAAVMLISTSPLRAEDKKPDLEPLRQKMCAGDTAMMVDLIMANVEFDLRVESLMVGDIIPIDEYLDEARAAFTEDMKNVPMIFTECNFISVAPISLESVAEQLEPVFTSMYADGEDTDPESVQQFIIKALKEMGVAECVVLEADLTLELMDTQETEHSRLLVGNTEKGWNILMSMDLEPSVPIEESEGVE